MKRYFFKSSYAVGEKYYEECAIGKPGFNRQSDGTLARKAGKAEWGEMNSTICVHSSDDLFVFSFNGVGHGGLVVVSREPVTKEGFVEERNANAGNFYGDYGGYVYCLEEDCNWSLLALILPLGVLQDIDNEFGGDRDKTKQQYERSLLKWHGIKLDIA